MAHSDALLTIIESPLFSKLWPDYWTEEERGEFAAFIANCPEAGDVIPGTAGCRKIRWSRAGSGKRSGVRVILHRTVEEWCSGVVGDLCQKRAGEYSRACAAPDRRGDGSCLVVKKNS